MLSEMKKQSAQPAPPSKVNIFEDEEDSGATDNTVDGKQLA